MVNITQKTDAVKPPEKEDWLALKNLMEITKETEVTEIARAAVAFVKSLAMERGLPGYGGHGRSEFMRKLYPELYGDET